MQFCAARAGVGGARRRAARCRASVFALGCLVAVALSVGGCKSKGGATDSSDLDVTDSGTSGPSGPSDPSSDVGSGTEEPDVTSTGSFVACVPADEGGACGECGIEQCVGDVLECVDPGFNVCGGCGELDGKVGDACEVDGESGQLVCDTAEGVLVCAVDPEENACGGTAELEGVPGDPCGPCGDGTWRCDGPERVVCGGASALNGCGGCGNLVREPETACGCGGGTWTCSEDRSAVVCGDPDANACGGCADLVGEIGDPCETACGAGSLQCSSSLESLRCFVDGEEGNACGGCTPLVHRPGVACRGRCGDGQWVCDEDGEGITCTADVLNACGECGELERALGSPCDGFGCGPGVIVCNPTGAGVVCDAPRRNACGGCDPEPEGFVQGEACGCQGTWRCVAGEPRCQGGTEVNACGGCEVLRGTPGNACSAVNACAVWTCEQGGGNVFCDQSRTMNACQGCEELPGDNLPGTACGCGGSWACDGFDDLRCVGSITNACGGCSGLAGLPGQPCGTCGQWACDGTDAVTCANDTPNVCGGCEPLAGLPGRICNEGAPGCSVWECDTEEGVVECVTSPPNACSGCGPLEGAPNTVCDDCSSFWTCDAGSVFCDNAGINACGGCEVLPGQPGDPCGEGGCALWACNDFGGVTCNTSTPLNACGACQDIGNRLPGERCGPCEDDVYVCTDEGLTECIQIERNACGGCAPLDNAPGSPCPCGGTWTCAPGLDSVECPAANVCGGCGFLDPFQFGSACRPPGVSGACGRIVCDGTEAFRCEAIPANACGGCSPIADNVAPGAPCLCGVYECDGTNQTRCPGLNSCGGCEPLENDELVGFPCGGPGECGVWRCTANGVECVATEPNACGGCLPIADATLGQACGCDGEVVCDGPNNVTCSAGNVCGGCLSPLPNANLIGQSCNPPGDARCGVYACVGADEVACDAVQPNDCGGCVLLDALPGSPCGPNDCGQLACAPNQNSLICDTSLCP